MRRALSAGLPQAMWPLRRPWGRAHQRPAEAWLDLVHGMAMRCPLQPGQVLHVAQGQLWLTRAGEPQDHVLGPGQRWVATRHELVWLSAAGPAACRVWRGAPAC
jgi:hypothetical protein